MRINSDELAEYIQAVLKGINKGITKEISANGESENFTLSAPVKFQLGITSSRESGGEVKIFVIGLHGGKENAEHARIEFEVSDSSISLMRNIDQIVTIWGKVSENERATIKSAVETLLALPNKKE